MSTDNWGHQGLSCVPRCANTSATEKGQSDSSRQWTAVASKRVAESILSGRYA